MPDGEIVIVDELPFSFGESPNYEYFNRVALQPQYRRVPRNTLKRHTQQAYYAYMAVRSAKRTFKLKCDEYGLRKKVIVLDTPTRWNSIYKLLHDAIAYRDVLTNIYNESRTDGHSFVTNDHLSLAMIIHDFLQTFDNATHIFSYDYEPNIRMVILECIKVIHSINAPVKNVLDNMKVSKSKV
ncbi:putative AC transposase [Bienertia sinuspersici]